MYSACRGEGLGRCGARAARLCLRLSRSRPRFRFCAPFRLALAVDLVAPRGLRAWTCFICVIVPISPISLCDSRHAETQASRVSLITGTRYRPGSPNDRPDHAPSTTATTSSRSPIDSDASGAETGAMPRSGRNVARWALVSDGRTLLANLGMYF
jgi:hypothetical protein